MTQYLKINACCCLSKIKKKHYLSPRNESPFAIFVLVSEKKAAAAFTVHSGALFKGTPSERDQPGKVVKKKNLKKLLNSDLF